MMRKLSLIEGLKILVIEDYNQIYQLFVTPWMDCSPPGSSVHGNSSGKNTGVGCHAILQGIFPTQGYEALGLGDNP